MFFRGEKYISEVSRIFYRICKNTKIFVSVQDKLRRISLSLHPKNDKWKDLSSLQPRKKMLKHGSPPPAPLSVTTPTLVRTRINMIIN